MKHNKDLYYIIRNNVQRKYPMASATQVAIITTSILKRKRGGA